MTEDLKGKTYVFYLRCSSEEQQQGFTHEYQLDNLERCRQVEGMKRLGVYKEAVSGRVFKRDELDLIYEVYEKARGALNYLLVYRWDRLGRDVGECFQAIKRFRNIGVEVNCPDRWIDYDNYNWSLYLGIEFGSAQSESDKISERTRDGLYAANSLGYFTGKPPVGYKRVYLDETRTNGKRRNVLAPDDNAELVRECFRLYGSGLKSKADLYYSYAERLGLRRSQFFEMFNNMLYIGLLDLKAYKKNAARIVRGQHEAIIDRDLWDQVRARDESRPTKSPSPIESNFYCKGVVRCLETGRNMTAYTVTKKSGQAYHYYRAISTKKGQSLAVLPVHSAVTQAMRALTLPTDIYSDVRDMLMDRIRANQERDRDRIKDLEKEAETLTTRLKNIQDAFADGVLTGDEYRSMKAQYTEQQQVAAAELAQLKTRTSKELDFRMRVLDMVVNLGQLFILAEAAEKKTLLQAVFPEGFCYEPKAHKVLTSRINSYISANPRTAGLSQVLEIKTGLLHCKSPAVGGEPDYLQTDRLLLEGVLSLRP